MRTPRAIPPLVLFLLLFMPARPSLSVTTTDLTSITPLQLAQMLAGPGVTVSNVTFTGATVAGGSFTGGLADGLGIASGVILSSGNIANAVGPNTNDGITTINGTRGTRTSMRSWGPLTRPLTQQFSSSTSSRPRAQ